MRYLISTTPLQWRQSNIMLIIWYVYVSIIDGIQIRYLHILSTSEMAKLFHHIFMTLWTNHFLLTRPYFFHGFNLHASRDLARCFLPIYIWILVFIVKAVICWKIRPLNWTYIIDKRIEHSNNVILTVFVFTIRVILYKITLSSMNKNVFITSIASDPAKERINYNFF